MKLELSKVADTLVSQSSMFQCSLDDAWEKYMHPYLTESFSYDEVKAYIDNNVNLGEKLDSMNEEIALKSIINHSLQVFPKAFINNSNEIILEPRNNVYFRLDGVASELDFKCKMFAWVSRPIAKGLNKYWSPKVLSSFNRLLNTNFTKEDMYKIYDRLGNDVNRQLTIQFIKSNYDLSLLERD